MKILYTALCDLNLDRADIKHSLYIAQSLGGEAEVTFLSGWITKKQFAGRLKRYGIQTPSFKWKRIPVIINTHVFVLELITRLLFGVFSLIYIFLNKYDAIYTEDFGIIYFFSLIPRPFRPKTKIFYEPHTIFSLTSEKVTEKQERKALKIPSGFLPISNGVRQDLDKIFDIQAKDTAIAREAVSLKAFEQVNPDTDYFKNKFPKTVGKKVVVYLGSFLPWKGTDDLIHGAAKVSNPDLHILLVGGSPENIQIRQQLIDQLGIGDKVTLEGYVSQDEVIKILKSSDIGIIPNNKTIIGSQHTSPMKIFEYLAIGLPIIASDFPAMREVLKEGENALFFESENVEELAKRIDSLSQDEALLASMRKNNIKEGQKYSWENRAKIICDFIQSKC